MLTSSVGARTPRAWVGIAFAVACIVLGAALGDSYIGRLPNHAGYFLVAVDDVVASPPALSPRVTAFIVVDGLRRDAAETMQSTRTLQASGQCRISDQGSFTVSRPEYALLSTGLEVDRTGARNNDLTSPIAAESLWQIAREAKRSVALNSHLPWFAELFPSGFDRAVTPEMHAEDVFAPPATGTDLLDVNVFHPLYVDEAGHEYGGASPEYAAAVARADREIAGLLARLDLTRDLVVLTADHGHRDEGGHGGSQPEVRQVLVCFAGPQILRRTDRGAFDGRSTAPALAVLLGLRFPRHMRAVEDGLDVIGEIVDPQVVGEPYLAERRRAVERFREANRRTLEGWLGGGPGTWSFFYLERARHQTLRAAGVLALSLGVVGLSFRLRRARLREVAETVAWVGLTVFVVWSVHHVMLGDFDFTVINRRTRFVPRAFAIGLSSALAAVFVHLRAFHDRARLVRDFLTLLGLVAATNLGHVVVYGWPLGFPLPSAAARYFPFFGAILLATFALTAVALVIVERRRARAHEGGDRAGTAA